MKYRKSQIGWLVISLFTPIILFLSLSYAYQWGSKPLPLIPFLLLAVLFVAISLLFYQLTVELKDSTLTLTYGIGLIRIRLKIDELHNVESIKTPWYYGLGIRVTPKGMLYNLQGLKAVKIEYTSDGKQKTVMIGTSEPKVLKNILEKNWSK